MNWPIEVIAHFNTQGKIVPYRLKYEDHKQIAHVIRIEKIIKESIKRYNGYPMKVFRCKIIDGNRTKIVTLFYEVTKCVWYMGLN